MKHKKLITAIAILATLITVGILIPTPSKCHCKECSCPAPCACDHGCGNGKCVTQTCGVDSAKMPLNLTVFIDLSNRVIHDADGTTQVNKDTIIINHLASVISKKAWKTNIRHAKDCFKVFFYPAPNDPTINNLAQNLDVDFGAFGNNEIPQKMQAATDLPRIVNDNVKVIYDNTVTQANYIGSDIWGFFNSKAKSYCIKSGHRNVLIVLTDGYIYHKNNLRENAEGQTTYITYKSLAAGKELIPCNQELSELEVLFLEINANPMSDADKIQSTICNWLRSMKISKYDVIETDLPSNTKIIIDNFINVAK